MQRQESSPMEKLAAVKCSVAAEAGPRSDFLWPSDTDTVLSIVMALAGEVATLYERVDTIERVVEQELGLSREKLDAFVASSAAQAERGQWPDAFVARLVRRLTQDVALRQDGLRVGKVCCIRFRFRG